MFQYILFRLILSGSRLRILPRLPSSSIFLTIPCFKRKFPSKIRPIQLAFLGFIVSKIFLSSFTPCNTSSFLMTRSAQLIFSILLQHHISDLLRYIWSTFRSFKVSVSYNATVHMQHFTTGKRRYLNSISGVLCEALYGARGRPWSNISAETTEQPCISLWKSFTKICWEDSELTYINPLNPELNHICYLLALLGAHRFLHVSRIRVKLLTFRPLMSYIYIYGAPILDVSRSHTTTQHSR